MDELGPETDNLRVEALGFVLSHEAHAQHMLICSTDIQSEKVIDGLGVEACNVQFSQNGWDVAEPACGLVRCGSVTENHRAGSDVSLDVKVAANATECRYDLLK